MADGALTVTFADDTLAALAARAEALGMTPQALAALYVQEQLLDSLRWVGDDPRKDHADNYDLNEIGRAWSEVRPELVTRMEQKLAGQK